jgi:hypothetical protein
MLVDYQSRSDDGNHALTRNANHEIGCEYSSYPIFYAIIPFTRLPCTSVSL